METTKNPFRNVIFVQGRESGSDSIIDETTIYLSVSIKKGVGQINLTHTDVHLTKIQKKDASEAIEEYLMGNMYEHPDYKLFILKLGGICKYFFNEILCVHEIEIIDRVPEMVSIKSSINRVDDQRKFVTVNDKVFFKGIPSSEWVSWSVYDHNKLPHKDSSLLMGDVLHLLSLEKIVSLPRLVEHFLR